LNLPLREDRQPLFIPLELLLSDWYRSAPLGERGGLIRYIRVITPVLSWVLIFTIVAMLPPMIVHCAFCCSEDPWFAPVSGAMRCHDLRG
jgi:hypothetical protein